MSDDSTVTALSGASGFFAGLRDVLVPHMNAKYNAQLAQQAEQRKNLQSEKEATTKFGREKEMEQFKLNILPGEETSIYDAEGNLQERHTGLPGQKTKTEQLKGESDKNFSIGEKRDQFYQREWDKILKDNDPNNASSRSVIGILGRTNLNANRAVATLSKPTVTKQEAGNVMADIASIYQGGAPTQFGMSHQEYDSLKSKIASAVQYVTGNPNDALPNDIKQRLLDVIKDMKDVNSTIVSNQLNRVERSQSKVISNFRDEWDNFKQDITANFSGGEDGFKIPKAGAPPKPKSEGLSDTAKVRRPDGKVGSIPRANLKKALSLGYKLIE